MTDSHHRRCERSEAIESHATALDCFVASLLAMTKTNARAHNE
jgi:hypothetical protein